MDLLGGRSDSLIGLDIGTHSVKMIQMDDASEEPRIKHLSVVRCDSERPESVEQAVSSAFAESGVATRKVACSVAGPSVAVRHLQFPDLSPEELKGAVWWEGEQVIPFSMDDVYTDFQILGKDEASGLQDVVFVAAARDLVNARSTLMRECGLEMRVLDVDGLAMVNEVHVEVEGQGAVAVVNVGARGTTLSIVDGAGIPFVRDILIAGNSFTEAISTAMEVPDREAEAMKTGDVHALSPRAVDEMEAQIRRLTEEVRTSLRYYGSHQEREVERILLTGGSSKLSLLNRLMSDELGISVEVWNPLEGVGMGEDLPSEYGPELCVALGLARRRDP